MKIRISIFTKLLIFALPLTCVPIALVGYFSYHTSIFTITNLSRQAELLQAQMAAERLDAIFRSCRMDLATMSHQIELKNPILGSRKGLLSSERGKDSTIFLLLKDFIMRSPFYRSVQLFDDKGNQIVSVPKKAHFYDRVVSLPSPEELENPFWIRRGKVYISRIFPSSIPNAFSVLFSRALYNSSKRYIGQLAMEIDYTKIIQLVTQIHIGKQGYAFLVDNLGRIIAHPNFKPYMYDLTRYPDANLREIIVDMISGDQGWKTYYLMGERAAAYAPIPSTGWSVAVTIPIQEFENEADLIKTRVKQAVLLTLVITILAIGLLSYQMLRPVRRLVAATKKLAAGDMTQQLPVKSSDELGALTSSFNKMVMNLRKAQEQLVRSEKLASIGRISAGVAHEIRNPLNAIMGGITLLKRRRKDDYMIQEYAQLILEEIQRLNMFITDFLYLAKQPPPKLIKIDIKQLITTTLTLFEEELVTKGIRVDFLDHEDTPLILVDPHQVQQVLINLIRNSIEAMPDGGKLGISVHCNQKDEDLVNRNEVIIEISDTGIGIPQEVLETVFEPFFSTKDTGTGLGLSISRGIVENHGGKLELMSVKGKGTTVLMTLPLRHS